MVAIDSLKQIMSKKRCQVQLDFIFRICTYPWVPLFNTFAIIKVLLFHILHFYVYENAK